MSTQPSPETETLDPLARFRRKIAANAAQWLKYVQSRPPGSHDLAREFPNLIKATEQALLEPSAWEDGLALANGLWSPIQWWGHWRAWQKTLQQALDVARNAGLPARQAELMDQLGEVARSLGDHREALIWQEQALAIFRELGELPAIARVLNRLSPQYANLGDPASGERCSQESAALFEQLGDQIGLAKAHNNWGQVYFATERWDEALAHFTTALELYTFNGDLRGQGVATSNQGQVHRLRGDWSQAEMCFRRAKELFEAAGDEISATENRISLAIVMHEQGDSETALAIHREIEPFIRNLGDRARLANVMNNQGAFLAALGRVNEALQAFTAALDVHLASGNLANAASTLVNMAEVLLDHGDVAHALSYLEQAKAILATLSSPPKRIARHHAEQETRATRMQSLSPVNPTGASRD